MKLSRALLVTLLAASVTPVLAQSYFKCTGANGKIEFSDRACGGTAKATELRHSSNVIGTGEARQQYGRSLPLASQDAHATSYRGQQTASQPSGNKCPSDQEIDAMETSASSITLGAKEKKFLQAEVARARACKSQGNSYSSQDWEEIKRANGSMSNIQQRDRDAARERAEQIHSSASPGAANAIATERSIAAERQEAARRQAEINAPKVIAACDTGGCWDTSGNRYNGSGSTFFRSDGRTCQKIGTLFQCN